MSRRTSEMTVPGKIRSLRMALRKANHPKVDTYDATYLRYVAEYYDTIEEAVAGLLKIDGEKA